MPNQSFFHFDPGTDRFDFSGSDSALHTAAIDVTGDAGFRPSTAQSDAIIRLDEFRLDARFAGIDGAGYTVVVLDTGIDLNHPFFGPDSNNDGVSDRIVFSADFTNDGDGTADDVNGHGTHVSGIVGSSDGTYPGVAPRANIIHLQVLSNSGSGSFSWLEQALQWIVNNGSAYNVVAVNMSLGDSGNYGSPQSLYNLGDEFQSLVNQGVVVIGAAGNSYSAFDPNKGVAAPAADPNVLAVGAVYDADLGSFSYGSGATAFSTGPDHITPFSQRDDDVIFAPGAAITNAGVGGGLATQHGTSQAAPHIAGIVALAQDYANEVLGRSLSVAEFELLLFDTADTIFDGDDENNNVANTNQSYSRGDVIALMEGIEALSGGGGSPGDGGGGPQSVSEAPGTDLPFSTATPGVVELGSPATGTIGSNGDRDAFTIDLVAGQTYVFELNGSPTGDGTLSDPQLFLYNPNAQLVASNDDGGVGRNALIVYTATSSGTHNLGADGWGSSQGSYTLFANVSSGGATVAADADDRDPGRGGGRDEAPGRGRGRDEAPGLAVDAPGNRGGNGRGRDRDDDAEATATTTGVMTITSLATSDAMAMDLIGVYEQTDFGEMLMI